MILVWIFSHFRQIVFTLEAREFAMGFIAVERGSLTSTFSIGRSPQKIYEFKPLFEIHKYRKDEGEAPPSLAETFFGLSPEVSNDGVYNVVNLPLWIITLLLIGFFSSAVWIRSSRSSRKLKARLKGRLKRQD